MRGEFTSVWIVDFLLALVPSPPRWKRFARKYDPERRRERKQATKLAHKIQQQDEIAAEATLLLQRCNDIVNNLEKALATEQHIVPPEDATLEVAMDSVMETTLPAPPTWNSKDANVAWVNAADCISEE